MAPPLPTGTVTLLFSDIEASTTVLRHVGDSYADVLTDQRSILRSAFERSGGRELGTEGDSFFVVFPSALAAVTAAVEGQRGLAGHAWPEGGTVRVRMGLHTGEPTTHDDGYVGMDVHLAARVAAAAHGGQVVVTEATRQVLLSRGAGGLSLQDLGWHRLKDFPDPQHLSQVLADGLASSFPPLRTLGARTHLPAQATTLVGREGELREVRDLLGGGARLVTLTGPGGSGKTRLAVAVAESMADEHPDGVYFVALESVTSAEVMWTTLAETLGLSSEQRDPAAIVDFLSGRHVLLVLDNLEQLPEAADVVQSLLAGAPGVRLLATSRRALHVYGEAEHPVPPLSLPGAGAPPGAVPGAVELFVQRARLVQPGFRPTADDLADVAEICHLVDGLPLAIELVAARLKFFPVRTLRSRLASDLELAVSRTPRPERHRTLRGAVMWSYGLLDPDLQRFFRGLGVCAGDADLAAVAAVSDGDLDAEDALEGLLDLSLVTVGEAASGETRVRLLRTISTYARELLVAAGEYDAARRRHARHYLSVVEEVAPLLRTVAHLTAKDRLEQELGNVRVALEWALPEPGGDGADPEGTALALRLCQALYWYWYAFGYQAEGRRWLSRVVAAPGSQDSPELMTALHGLGVLLAQHGDAEQGRDALQRTLAYWRRTGDAGRIARELSSLAVVHRALGEPVTARAMLVESLELARTTGQTERVAAALSNLAILDVDEHEPGQALERLHEALALDRERGDGWAVVADTLNIAAAQLHGDRPGEAYDTLRAVAREAVDLGDPDMSVALVELLAVAIGGLGDCHRAARMVGAATAMRAAHELPLDPADAAILERGIAPVRRGLDEAAWDAEATVGATYDLDQALADALRPPESVAEAVVRGPGRA